MIYYIFLDVDGVLNDEVHIEKCYDMNGGHSMFMRYIPFDPKALFNLMTLIKQIRLVSNEEPRIILSSSWRLNEIDTEIVKARIAEYGLRLFDKTSYIHCDRGLEIETFLNKQELDGVTNYNFVILDDDKFDIETKYPNNLVYIDRTYGLTENDVNKALKILKIKENDNDKKRRVKNKIGNLSASIRCNSFKKCRFFNRRNDKNKRSTRVIKRNGK